MSAAPPDLTGQRWTPLEEQLLVSMRAERRPYAEIAAQLGRKVGACRQQMVEMRKAGLAAVAPVAAQGVALLTAAIAVARSEVAAVLPADQAVKYEAWPEMDRLVAVLDRVAPGWRDGAQ